MGFDRRNFLQTVGVSVGAGALGTGGSGTVLANPAHNFVQAHYTNYTSDNRTAADVDWIVCHVPVMSYQNLINYVDRNNDRNVSYHFIVSNLYETAGTPGEITQLVDTSDRAHHAKSINHRSIGISHEWRQAGDHFTDECYQASAELIRFLADKYDIPLQYYHNRECIHSSNASGIIGHRHTPSNSYCSEYAGDYKSCPGPDWEANRLMQFVHDGSGGGNIGHRFEDGDIVATTTASNTRESPGLNDDVVAVMDEGSAGEIINGPEYADGYTWWGVHFQDDTVVGWTAGSLLTKLESGGDNGDDEQEQGEESDTFDAGDTVGTTVDLNGRDEPHLDSAVLTVMEEGTTAEIVGGGGYADGYNWWELDLPTESTNVWAVERYLDPVSEEDEDHGDSVAESFTINTDLNRYLDVTGSEIDQALQSLRPGSPLIGLGDTFVAAGQEFEIDAIYILAHAVHESAWGESDIAQDHNNLFGWNAVDSDPYGEATRFDSFEDCIWEVMEQVKELYLTPGNWRYHGPHLEGMNEYYATDPDWDVKIADHYRTIASEIGDIEIVGEDELPDEDTEHDFDDDAIVVRTTTNLNLRECPDLDCRVLVQMATGTEAEVLEGPVESGSIEWYYLDVPAYSEPGWASAYYLETIQGTLEDADEPTEEPVSERFEEGDEVVTTASTLNGREQPTLDAVIVEQLPEGTTAEVVNGPESADGYVWWGLHVPEYNEWVWCVERHLDDAETGTDDGTPESDRFEEGDQVVTTASHLNGREQPHLDATVLESLPEGTTAEVVNGPASNDGYTWWGLHVPEYNEWVWCVEAYLDDAEPSDDSGDDPVSHTFEDGDEVVTTASSLNGREQPHLNATILESLPEGTTAEVVNGPEEADGYTWWGLHVPEYNEWVWCVEAYLDHADGTGGGTTYAFQHGDEIVTTAGTLNGREHPNLNATILQQLPQGTTGEVVNGPEQNDGYTWWGLYIPAYNVWVWCVEEYLEHA